jgi:hypothetical protein
MSVDPTTTAVFGLTFACFDPEDLETPFRGAPEVFERPTNFREETAKTALGHPPLRARGAAGVVVPTRAASDREG